MVNPEDVQVHVANLDGRKIVSICWSEEDPNTTIPRNHQIAIPFDVFVISMASDEVGAAFQELL